MEKDMKKQAIAKGYEAYTKEFTPEPPYLKNSLWAFFTGGGVCTLAYAVNNLLMELGLSEKNAQTFVTIGIIMLAQLLTALGPFDAMAKHAGAGVIVPISGFANSMVAPAMEYKKEGIVLGAGAKLFTVAGPVLVCGITSATVVGIIYWLLGML